MNVAMARTRKDTSRIAKAGVETGANMLGGLAPVTVGRSWLLSAKAIASDVDERWIRKVHPVSPLAFPGEQTAGQMQTIGSIEGQARFRKFLTTPREKGSSCATGPKATSSCCRAGACRVGKRGSRPLARDSRPGSVVSNENGSL